MDVSIYIEVDVSNMRHYYTFEDIQYPISIYVYCICIKVKRLLTLTSKEDTKVIEINLIFPLKYYCILDIPKFQYHINVDG